MTLTDTDKTLDETDKIILWAYRDGATEDEALRRTDGKPGVRQHRRGRKRLQKLGYLRDLQEGKHGPGKHVFQSTEDISFLEKRGPTNKYEDVENRSWIYKSMLERIQAAFQKMVKYRRDSKDDEARRIGDDILPVLREIKKEDLSFPYSESMHSRLIYPSRVIVVSKTGGPGDQQTNVPNDQSKAWLEWSQKVIEYCKDKLLETIH